MSSDTRFRSKAVHRSLANFLTLSDNKAIIEALRILLIPALDLEPPLIIRKVHLALPVLASLPSALGQPARWRGELGHRDVVGAVFVGANDNRVHALRASDGHELWQYRAEGPPASGIAVADRIVYAGGNDYMVHALRVGNGRPVWAFTADGPVESQIAAAGRVAFVGSNGGQVYALTR